MHHNIWLHIWNIIFFYFKWPYGGVWGNVWAIIPTGILATLAAYFGRHKIGKALVKWWHKHWTAHIEALEKELREHEQDQNGHKVQISP